MPDATPTTDAASADLTDWPSAPNGDGSNEVIYTTPQLPERFRWTVHNLFAHPLSELLFQVGLGDLGNRLHDWTIPEHEPGTGRG